MTTNTKFQPGKTYLCRSVCDYDTTWTFRVASRTASTIRTECGKTLRINKTLTGMDGVEAVQPLGRYSMAPILKADKVIG